MKYDEFHELTTGDQFYLINLYGQNHMLTSFSKTIFPNLSLFLVYLKTNFAFTQSKYLKGNQFKEINFLQFCPQFLHVLRQSYVGKTFFVNLLSLYGVVLFFIVQKISPKLPFSLHIQIEENKIHFENKTSIILLIKFHSLGTYLIFLDTLLQIQKIITAY